MQKYLVTYKEDNHILCNIEADSKKEAYQILLDRLAKEDKDISAFEILTYIDPSHTAGKQKK